MAEQETRQLQRVPEAPSDLGAAQQESPQGMLGVAASRSAQGMLGVAASRSAQEVQAAMVVAKKFRRDIILAYGRIMTACQRKGLAEQAAYVFPRGNDTVTGPSIRLAEVLMQNWGNMQSGIIQLSQGEHESVMMAFAWDMETNARDSKVFNVPHQMKAYGKIKDVTDPRDIYELTANMGARRKRACILAIIPGDVVEDALLECDKTLAGNTEEPLIDRVRKMVSYFGDMGVTPEMVESRLGHLLKATTEQELSLLRKIAKTIKDGMAGPSAYFKPDDLPDTDGAKQSFGLGAQKQPPPEPDQPPAEPQQETAAPPEPGLAPSPPASPPGQEEPAQTTPPSSMF